MKNKSALVLLLLSASVVHAEELKIQSLEVTQENKISYEEFRALVNARINDATDSDGAVTSGNYASVVTSGNYANVVTSSNYADVVTSGNYADVITSSNYGQAVVDEAIREQSMPSPQMAQ
jgi:hypothetical protein